LQLQPSEGKKQVVNTAPVKSVVVYHAPAVKAAVTKTDAELMDEFDALQDQIIGKSEKMSSEQQAVWGPKFEMATIGKSLAQQVSAMNDLYQEMNSAGF